MNLPSRFLDEMPEHLLAREGDIAENPTPRQDIISSELTGELLHDDTGFDFDQRSAAERGSLRVGLHVRHPQFGVGVIRRHEGRGDQQKVIVSFQSGRTKTLLVRYAHLKIMNS